MEEKKVCKNCKEEYIGNIRFCKKCGRKLEDVDENIEFGTQCGIRTVEMEVNNEDTIKTRESDKTEKSNNYLWPIVEGIILTVILIYFNAGIFTIGLLWIINVIFILEECIDITFLKIVVAILSIMFLFNLYDVYLNNKYMRMVMKEEYYGVSYEDLFDNFSEIKKWKCTGNERFTALNYSKSERYNGGFIGKVAVSGDCRFNDEEAEYKLTFYISEIDKEILPVILEINGESYSDEINEFLLAVYNSYNEKYNFR